MFFGLRNLNHLTLWNNKIKSIEDYSLSHLIALTELNLSSNQLTFISKEMFSGLRNLTLLTLWNNNIKSIEDDSFSHLIALTELNLGSNQFTSIIKGMFYGLPNLTLLNIINNKIKSIEADSFIHLIALTELDLTGNPLTEIGAKAFAASWYPHGIKLILDQNFLCCSRVLYNELSFVNGNCTFEGNLEIFNDSFQTKCPTPCKPEST
jgi:Leucine-rich repeat (LRR) protein